MVSKPLKSLSEAEISSLVACYRAVFAGPPWNEAWRCECGAKIGSQAVENLRHTTWSHCGRPVHPFWPEATVQADLQALRERPSDVSLAGFDGRQAIAFCLGYGTTAQELQRQLEIEICPLLRRLGTRPDQPIAYQDDLGVLPAYRQHGLACQLFRQRLEGFRQLGLTVGVVRTLAQPRSVTYDWYGRLGYRIVAVYPHDGRVVMAIRLDQLPF